MKVTINGITFEGTVDEIRQLLSTKHHDNNNDDWNDFTVPGTPNFYDEGNIRKCYPPIHPEPILCQMVTW